jgi:hypothetical protein
VQILAGLSGWQETRNFWRRDLESSARLPGFAEWLTARISVN